MVIVVVVVVVVVVDHIVTVVEAAQTRKDKAARFDSLAVEKKGGKEVAGDKKIERASEFMTAQWVGTTKIRDGSNGPLACPFAGSLAPLTHLLTGPPLSSFVHSLIRSLAHSRARGKVNDYRWEIFSGPS